MPPRLVIRRERPDTAAAQDVTRRYLAEVVGRYYGRSVTNRELNDAIAEFATADLVPPGGVFLLAWFEDRAIGSAGLRIGRGVTGEVVRVFVDERHRRCGIARELMREIELEARKRGMKRLRLDTRGDLTEARQLYHSIGFSEVAPFNNAPYADHWFERSLLDAEA